MNKLKRDSNRFAFMENYDLESEDDLFQIEVDALEAIAPTQFRTLVLQSVDEFFDEEIYQDVLKDTPTKQDLNELAKSRTEELLANLQNEEIDNNS